MNFKPQVLDKYKNNDLCDIGSDHISSLRHDKTSVLIASFVIRDNVLKMFAKEFNNIPPIDIYMHIDKECVISYFSS
jgi:hypothetical protein